MTFLIAKPKAAIVIIELHILSLGRLRPFQDAMSKGFCAVCHEASGCHFIICIYMQLFYNIIPQPAALVRHHFTAHENVQSFPGLLKLWEPYSRGYHIQHRHAQPHRIRIAEIKTHGIVTPPLRLSLRQTSTVLGQEKLNACKLRPAVRSSRSRENRKKNGFRLHLTNRSSGPVPDISRNLKGNQPNRISSFPEPCSE